MKKLSLVIVLLVFIAGIYFWRTLSTHQEPHGIILISLDTLRADHLGTYGYQRNTSPTIDAFAKESIVFENAVVQAPNTLPSHMSIMTSLYPHFHGVKSNTSLPEEGVTLAELLREGGFATAAFTDGGWMRAAFGFSQGFETYDGEEKIGIAKILPKVKKWLDKNSSQPFFLFLHCYDIHSPYDPPPPYDTMFHDTVYTVSFVPSTENLRLAAWNHIRLNDQDLRYAVCLYDGGIRYTDDMLGKFFAYLRNANLYDKTLIIVTSDHGEEFMEHGSFLHWQLYYRPNLHVPLIIHLPASSQKGVRIDDLVQSIDLLPTVLDLAGLPEHSEAQGKSLVPVINAHSNFLYFFLRQAVQLFSEDFPLSFSETRSYLMRGRHVSVIGDDYQMIYNKASQALQLFNIHSDPFTQDNVAKNHSDIVENLLSGYTKFYSTLSTAEAPTLVLDKQTEEQLEALGYIEIPQYAVKDGDNFSLNEISFEDDSDLDGVADNSDNCVYLPNFKQEDKDSDGVGDLCDNCPDSSNPEQGDENGNGIGNECESFPESHVLEAEHADSIADFVEVTNDVNASNQRFLHVPNGKTGQYRAGTIVAVYTVTVEQSGTYVLWGRVQAPTKKDNSFFVQMDDGSDNLWEIDTGKHWHWDQVNNRNRVDPAKFILTKGVHSIHLKLREDGTKLDKLLLTSNLDYVPNNQAGTH